MIGIPTPTCEPSLIWSETCTGFVATTGLLEAVDVGAVGELEEVLVAGLLVCEVPVPEPEDEHAVTSRTAAPRSAVRPASRVERDEVR
jgi:hypothetical protein